MTIKRVLVIGAGRFGTALVETLWRGGAEVTVLDTKAEAVDAVKDRTSHAYVGDATNPKVLEGLGPAETDSVIVTFGMAFEATVLCVATLRRMGARYVVARAETERQSEILLTVGAHRVMQIEAEMGQRLGRDLLSPIAADLHDLADEYRVLPWVAEGSLVGRSLQDAAFRREHGLTVLGYRRRKDGERGRLAHAAPEYVIEEGDTLLLVGEKPQFDAFFAKARKG